MALVGKAGIDKHQYLDILTSTLFGAPVYKTYGTLIADANFTPPGFAAPLGLKDVKLALAAADESARAAAAREPVARPFSDAARERRRQARLVGGRRSCRKGRRRRIAAISSKTGLTVIVTNR